LCSCYLHPSCVCLGIQFRSPTRPTIPVHDRMPTPPKIPRHRSFKRSTTALVCAAHPSVVSQHPALSPFPPPTSSTSPSYPPHYSHPPPPLTRLPPRPARPTGHARRLGRLRPTRPHAPPRRAGRHEPPLPACVLPALRLLPLPPVFHDLEAPRHEPGESSGRVGVCIYILYIHRMRRYALYADRVDFDSACVFRHCPHHTLCTLSALHTTHLLSDSTSAPHCTPLHPRSGTSSTPTRSPPRRRPVTFATTDTFPSASARPSTRTAGHGTRTSTYLYIRISHVDEENTS
jgi:hypothetical protein